MLGVITNVGPIYRRMHGIKEPIHGHQNCYTNQILIFGGYVKVKESLYTRVIIWVNTILNHIDTSTILPR